MVMVQCSQKGIGPEGSAWNRKTFLDGKAVYDRFRGQLYSLFFKFAILPFAWLLKSFICKRNLHRWCCSCSSSRTLM